MNNKNSTQIVIPFNFKGKDLKPYAQQHWNITFARQKQISVYAKRIIALVLAQIERNVIEFQPYYQLHVTDVLNPSAKDNQYSAIKKAFNELTDLKWLIEDIDKNKFAYRHLLNTSHAMCGYDNGRISVALNPLLKDYFVALSHYTTYELKWYMTFQSWYSMRIFEILSARKDIGFWEVDIDHYRTLMDCDNKYKKTPDLISRTTAEPLEELSKTDLSFKLEKVYEVSPLRKGRPAVVGLRFILSKKQLKTIPKSWKDKSPKHELIINKMTKKWKIEERNFIKYIEFLGIEGAEKLMKEWEQKQLSNRRIDDVKKYCNASFVAEAKKNMKPQTKSN